MFKARVVDTGPWRALAALLVNNLPDPDKLDPEVVSYFQENPGMLHDNLEIALNRRALRLLTDDERARLEVKDDETLFVTDAMTIAPGCPITLGNGFIFTVEEVLELTVDSSPEPAELLKRGGHNPSDWEYVVTRPSSETKKVKAVIGRLNHKWTEERVAELLGTPSCPLRGSGAWAREAFLAARPQYDGKGSIAFPDAATSRWRNRNDDNVYFPNLWNDDASWNRNLNWVSNDWNPENRLCLICAL